MKRLARLSLLCAGLLQVAAVQAQTEDSFLLSEDLEIPSKSNHWDGKLARK